MDLGKIYLIAIIFPILLCEDNLFIKIGDKTFPFTLKDTAAARELKNKLPFKVGMTKLNENEIYYQFSQSFTTDTKSVGTINTGDIYLYQNNYLVLFYKTFTTTYSYTEIGKLDTTEGLADAIGSNSPVTVEWHINDEPIDDDDEKFTNYTSYNSENFSAFNYLLLILIIFL